MPPLVLCFLHLSIQLSQDRNTVYATKLSWRVCSMKVCSRSTFQDVKHTSLNQRKVILKYMLMDMYYRTLLLEFQRA